MIRANSPRARATVSLGLALGAAVFVLLPGVAEAGIDLGIRGGLTRSPDQVHAGGHIDLGPIGNHVSLRPNLEVGVGDDVVILALNFEATYRFRSQWQVWSPYVGSGLGVNFVDPDNDALAGSPSTESGPLLLLGLDRGFSSGGRIFLESKIGLANAPDLKFTVGWTFGDDGTAEDEVR